MSNNAAEPRTESPLWFGVSLLLVGGLFLFFAKDIRRLGMSNEHDPGPQFLPVMMSSLLLAGGVLELCRFARRKLAGQAGERVERPPADGPRGDLAGTMRVVYLAVGLLAYSLATGWFGFFPTTLVFVTVSTMALGARWWVAPLAGAVMVGVVYGLFVHLFRVQLPSGTFFYWE